MWSAGAQKRRQRHAARGKDELLAVTMTVIAQSGLDGTRFADVARATGTAISTLQYYYGSREDLLIACIEYAANLEAQRLERIESEDPDPTTRALDLVHAATESSERAGNAYLFWTEIGRAALRSDEIREIYLARHAAWLRAWTDVVARGVDADQFHPPSAPADAAIEILALLDGLNMLRVAGHEQAGGSGLRALALTATAPLLGISSLGAGSVPPPARDTTRRDP